MPPLYENETGELQPEDSTVKQPAGLSLLEKLGWQQDRYNHEHMVNLDDEEKFSPVRVTEVHSNGVRVLGNHGLDQRIRLKETATVGDWLLLDHDRPKRSLILERKSLLTRKAPGQARKTQLIAANIDTLFIVTSCNQDFNIARLERYVALAWEAQVSPVIVLTKADLVDSALQYLEEAQETFRDRVPVVALDARGSVEKLQQWCQPGQTVAFVGSSGVGKSSLTNALMEGSVAETNGIRADDDKGRHTTTGRHLYLSPTSGCAIVDTPGMRELQLFDVASGVATVFEDLQAIAQQCRFHDCRHDGEPGCAIREAMDQGTIDAKRVKRWQKLTTEDAHNSATVAQRKSKDKALGKKIRQMQKTHRKYNN